MKIKNTKELRLRANSHTKLDHIKQGTYGLVKLNGHPEYRGCAIGCLSTPHRKRDFLRFVKATIDTLRAEGVSIRKGRWQGFADGYKQRDALAKEFGITENLAIVAEACFEGQVKHGAAIEFIRDFAFALPEGADIQDRHVVAFLERRGVTVGWNLNYYDIKQHMMRSTGGIPQFTMDFLDWLRSRAPKQPVSV